ncbi:MAG: MBL fold metallo-hydrolase [Acidobacteria bacterium]|nr:MBL fold metallo-hydrolase [Acidobacteriota bacterium]
MRVDYKPEGIYLPAIDLWLDPLVPVDAAWLSHAHSDHARGLHQTIIATGITVQIYRHRWPLLHGRTQEVHRLNPNESIEWNGATLTARQAAHILGAAQLLVEYNGERLVYTGDIKHRAPICGWTTEATPCDHLIIESTFGLPIYQFLEAADAQTRIAAFARECLAAGQTPVFQGYGLGRGQEIAHTLALDEIPCEIHPSIAAFIPYYEAQNYTFPSASEGGAVLVTPGRKMPVDIAAAKRKVALVSGWAALDNARARSNADVLIPYSDHADFYELLALIHDSQAQQIDIVHGYAEPFAHILRKRGLSARAAMLTTEAQI